MTNHGPKKVLIIGAGFGGLDAAKALVDTSVEVTIVDRQNHHLFQPLLYQVATAGLNPSDIAQPIRHILAKQKNCQPILANVTGIDTGAQLVTTSVGALPYDFLILATGATHDYFGNDQWAEHAPGLKSIEDALDIRRRILLAFERADLANSDEERERLMTFVVVGAGPTGVEMAGAIREIATQTLRRDFRRIDTTKSEVILVEAGAALLASFPEKLQQSATDQLESLGVDVRTNTRVADISADGVTTSEGFIPSATVIWGAGVAASPLGAELTAETDRSGRAIVESDLSVAGHRNVFAIGDVAACTDANGDLVPGVAPAAGQGGEHAAKCIIADITGTPRPTFVYKHKGSMATIGRSKAVADLGPRLQFGGVAAWLLWCFVHIWSLIGFRSRMRTMGSWMWQYFTGHRGARLITGNTLHAEPTAGTSNEPS
jgi:NADH dehydrogenase